MVEILTQDNKLRENIIKKLKDRNQLENYGGEKNIKVTKIADGIYGVEGNTHNIAFYVNEKGENIFSTKGISQLPYFKNAQLLTGVVENKLPTGEFVMYKIKTINGKQYPDGLSTLLKGNLANINIGVGEKIDKYSMQYYNVWVDTSFYQRWLFNETLKLPPAKGENYSILPEDYLLPNIEAGVLRIKDLVRFLEQGQLEGGQDLFKLLLPKVREKLLEQIGDKRFDMVGDPVTAEEIQDYFRCGYISKELYIQSINLLKELGKIDEEMVNRLKKDILPDLESLRNSIINK